MFIPALDILERKLAVVQQLAEFESDFLPLAGVYLKLNIARHILPEVEQLFPLGVTDNLGLKRSFSAIGKLFDALGKTLQTVSLA